jgi:hypothetical protein
MPVQPGRYGPGVPGAAWQYFYSGLTSHYSSPATPTPSGVVTQPEPEEAPPVEEYFGTGSLSQASTATAAGRKQTAGGATTITQSSTSTAAGGRVVGGSGTITLGYGGYGGPDYGGGPTTTATGTTGRFGTATTSQASTTTAAGGRIVGGPATLNQPSTAAAAGTKSAAGSGSLTQTSTAAATATRTVAGTGTISQPTTLNATTTTGRSGTGTFTGYGGYSGSHYGAGPTTTATTTATGTSGRLGAATISVLPSVSASGLRVGGGTTGITQPINLSATGTTARSGTGSIDHTSSVTGGEPVAPPTPPPVSRGSGAPHPTWHRTQVAWPPQHAAGQGTTHCRTSISATGLCARAGSATVDCTIHLFAAGHRNVLSDRQRTEDELLLIAF